MQNVTLLVKPASSLCNMRCSYCFYADVSSRRETRSFGIMSEQTLETMIRRAFAFADGSLSFVFQGGEPTLTGLDFFKLAITLQKKYNAKAIPVYNTIQTNGLLLDDEWAEFFKENGFLVGISLDGQESMHDKYRRLPSGDGSFGRVTAAAELLGRHGVDFNILTVVTRDTAQNGRCVYRALRKYGYLQFIPLIDDMGAAPQDFSLGAEDYGRFLVDIFDEYYHDVMSGRYVSIRDMDSYINMLRGMPPSSCAMQGRCGGYFTVEADGSVYPCDFYVTDEYKMGNITATSFFSLAKSAVADEFIKSSLTRAEGCAECKYFSLCRGGCRRYREPLPDRSKFCAAYKYFFDRCIDRMVEIARAIDKLSAKNNGGNRTK